MSKLAMFEREAHDVEVSRSILDLYELAKTKTGSELEVFRRDVLGPKLDEFLSMSSETFVKNCDRMTVKMLVCSIFDVSRAKKLIELVSRISEHISTVLAEESSSFRDYVIKDAEQYVKLSAFDVKLMERIILSFEN